MLHLTRSHKTTEQKKQKQEPSLVKEMQTRDLRRNNPWRRSERLYQQTKKKPKKSTSVFFNITRSFFVLKDSNNGSIRKPDEQHVYGVLTTYTRFNGSPSNCSQPKINYTLIHEKEKLLLLRHQGKTDSRIIVKYLYT